MSIERNRLTISCIQIGFANVVPNGNYRDCHQPLKPFGMNWGRGILIRGDSYLEAATGPYGYTHSRLKKDLDEGETTAGAFYYGYSLANHCLYLEYASESMFDFRNPGVLDAIMESLRRSPGPLKGFRVKHARRAAGSPGTRSGKT